ncbi:MAG TPA: heparan-alpha-glucosaminide N-acetyltransferase domain-containing protein [Hymenobacter sp.]|uniref:acyltransferase family protein n=1 Tax=Hymenobacter sp. TaxID=1898978 RepID=UPI002D8086BD|nr:heparan-alpha-glucosaminide N-acetyltransferase domain-containing protein [Hymenobacter sp.]HET9502431.1 heparan-alpha-glucosaminide N-acetyltransferase domain-containing protein [Hymenobacter sp.]
MSNAIPAAPARLLSLDVFRGLTVMGMVVVNNPGDWGHIYPPLEHAEWHGCTPTDLVFPFFLFIVGVSLAYALAGPKQRHEPQGPVLRQVLRRAAVLFGLGLLLSLYPRFDFSVVRVMGVLQRIALVYLGCSVSYLKTSWRTQVILLISLLIGYAALLQLVPVPGVGPANLAPATNLGAWLDRAAFTEAHLWKQSRTWDPEGLLGTLPALSTGLLGGLAAQWLRRAATPATKVRGLLAAGVLCALLGLLWNTWFPINKALWTSSYVLFTGGLALLVLAALYWLCDVRDYRRWAALVVPFGVNAIAVFVGSALLSRTFGLFKLPLPGGGVGGLKEWLYSWGIVPFFSDPRQASLAGAVVCLLVWWAVLSLLYRRQWVWKA